MAWRSGVQWFEPGIAGVDVGARGHEAADAGGVARTGERGKRRDIRRCGAAGGEERDRACEARRGHVSRRHGVHAIIDTFAL